MYKQTGPIFDNIQSLHHSLFEYYSELNTKTTNIRVKLLLDHLCKIEKNHQDAIVSFMENASKRVRNYWVQDHTKFPKLNIEDCIRKVKISDNLCIDELVELAIKFDECVACLYQSLINESEFDEMKDIFQGLLNKMKQEEKKLVRDVQWLYDM